MYSSMFGHIERAWTILSLRLYDFFIVSSIACMLCIKFVHQTNIKIHHPLFNPPTPSNPITITITITTTTKRPPNTKPLPRAGNIPTGGKHQGVEGGGGGGGGSSFWLVNPRREVTVHEVKEKRGGWGVCGFEFTVLYGGILFIELQYLATRLINKPTD